MDLFAFLLGTPAGTVLMLVGIALVARAILFGGPADTGGGDGWGGDGDCDGGD